MKITLLDLRAIQILIKNLLYTKIQNKNNSNVTNTSRKLNKSQNILTFVSRLEIFIKLVMNIFH